MAQRIAILQGHPDPEQEHFGHALANAYTEGAREAGREVRCIEVAKLDFPILRSQAEYEDGNPPASIRQAQETILWAEHLVLIYPLWLGTMPALFKGFLEQVLRPELTQEGGNGAVSRGVIAGRSAHIVVTMGMPAFIYRWYFGAHSLKNLERNILGFCGIAPIRDDLIGTVDKNPEERQKWLDHMRELGQHSK